EIVGAFVVLARHQPPPLSPGGGGGRQTFAQIVFLNQRGIEALPSRGEQTAVAVIHGERDAGDAKLAFGVGGRRTKVEALLFFGLHAERRGRRRALKLVVHRRELQAENSEIESRAANRQRREQRTRIQ